MNTPGARSIAFEEHYDDGSGVEFAVRYEHNGDPLKGQITFEDVVGKATFPVSHLWWLFGCLKRIQDEIDFDANENGSP